MPKYLFTSDQRISALPERIKWVAEFINTGHNVSEIVDKSDNNNAATLKFYYNLHKGTETCELAVKDPIFAIRNFVLKFQFPNVRTYESLQNTISEKLFLAPYRSVVSLLVALNKVTDSTESALSLTEILYFIFCNPKVYKTPIVKYDEIASDVLESRRKEVDLELEVSRTIEWNQYARQARELINVLTYASKCFTFSKGFLKYSSIHVDYELDKEYINSLLTYNRFWYPSNIKDFNLSTQEYTSYMNTANTPYTVVDFSQNIETKPINLKEMPLQQITFGAPGTGKSHSIQEATKGHSVIRTTFHPDSDYSTFVGAYKPVMEDAEVRVIPVVFESGMRFEQNKGTMREKRITYKFVKQAFLKAYLGAWKKYADGGDKIEPQFLLIEEINRGNCAQIFGDLFQLLDRNDENNFSAYPIEADTDLQKEIEQSFAEDMDGNVANPYKLANNIDIEGAVTDYTSNYGATLSEDVQTGRVLLLPPNLYIWATMNTSDQSLFPIDSAFKRRWAWDYVKITDGQKGWTIKGNDYTCDWWTFIQEVNKKISSATNSDDKKLGYFFCKAKKDETFIDEKTFVSKVIFYLWNDVFKDDGNTIFEITDTNERPSFDVFYMEDENGKIVPNSESVKKFLINVVGSANVIAEHSQTQDGEPNSQPEI